ncbi:MAG: AAA family ATPase, partial [Candidatus Peribacteraceae bacterium]|nr:AAA family ATPase [Candidatus Peribacteraceae bacterium]
MQDVIFKDIEMWNFRSHEHMTMDFLPNRFLVITGENGAGKSTIFDALCWSLYDLTTNKRKGDAVIRKRAGKNTGVVANFDVGEDEYRIENYRKHKEKKDGKFLYKNDEL